MNLVILTPNSAESLTPCATNSESDFLFETLWKAAMEDGSIDTNARKDEYAIRKVINA